MVSRVWRRGRLARKAADHDSDVTRAGAQAPGGSARDGVTHRSPSPDSPEMPCCGRTPAEIPAKDRVTTDPAQVTCRG